MAGFVILIPIALLALDMVMTVAASQINEHLAEDAARAASSQICGIDARAAAATSLASYSPKSYITSVEITDFTYDLPNSQVRVVTSMQVKLPVPIAKLACITLRADAVQPIVGIPAPF
jgi:hypothetical protein